MVRITLIVIISAALTAAAFATQLCPSCGAANPDENNFCEACGSPLKAMVTCPQCGEVYPDGTVACSKCGYAFLKPKTITITAEPAKAIIYVNGIEKGKGPIAVTLAPGESAEVEARYKGYGKEGRTLSYDGMPLRITLTLAKTPGDKPAKERPAGARRLRSELTVSAGMSILTGATADYFGASPTVEVKYAAHFFEAVPPLAVEVALGYHAKHSYQDPTFTGPYFSIVPVSLGVSYGVGLYPFRVSFSGGAGSYFYSYGGAEWVETDALQIGFYAGSGVTYGLGAGSVSLSLTPKFNFVNFSQGSEEFIDLLAGVSFQFF